MNSLGVFQYEDIKTAIQAQTTTGNFSIIWPETIMNEVARELDRHDGFLVDENSTRVSWRDPAYPTREVPALLSSDRAFVSSIMTLLEHISFTRRERYSNDSYYSYFEATPNLPSATLIFLRNYYVDSIMRQESDCEDSSKYFIKWTREFSITNRAEFYKKLVSQYQALFIHL